MLEYFVETKLAQSLHGVAKERRCPAFPQLTYPRLLESHPEPIDDATIFTGVNLDAAFDEIQRHHCCVCYTATENATKATQGVVLG